MDGVQVWIEVRQEGGVTETKVGDADGSSKFEFLRFADKDDVDLDPRVQSGGRSPVLLFTVGDV